MTKKKNCSVCGKKKSVDEFGKKAAAKDGLSPSCKKCFKERYGGKKKTTLRAAKKKTTKNTKKPAADRDVPDVKNFKLRSLDKIGAEIAESVNNLVEARCGLITEKINEKIRSNIDALTTAMNSRLSRLRAEHIKTVAEFHRLKEQVL